MEHRSWLWRRKSLSKSPGETESSGSVSSHSERYSDDQEALRASSSNTSPNHAQSPEVSSKIVGCEVHETVESLTEKLSAALLNIRAKEDLVKQHTKVAEEAVSGWEKAETELAALKQQLEAAAQKNSALEDRIGHLDGALKECVRQLRQVREEQEQKVHHALIKKTREWESDKFELESRLVELQTQLETAKFEVATSIGHELQLKLEAAEKENLALKVELLDRSEVLQLRTLERELSTRSAETASKQHLESIKKVAKLEAECRRLRAAARRTLSASDHKRIASLGYVESITDSHSDSGERLLSVDNELSCSDSWASALIAELDQFKNEKVIVKDPSPPVEIDLMDDFLEMERLAALPETDRASSSFEHRNDSEEVVVTRDDLSQAELKNVHHEMAELEEKVKRMELEKSEMEMDLAETRKQLEISCNQLILAEDKLFELQKELDSTNKSKQVVEIEIEAAVARRKELEFQLELAHLETQKLHEKVGFLERKVEEEKALSMEFAAKYRNLEDELSSTKQESELRRAAQLNGELKIKQDKERAVAAVKLADCQKTIASLSLQLKSLATIEDLMLDAKKPVLNGGSPDFKGRGDCLENTGDSSSFASNKGRVSPPTTSSLSSSSSLSGFEKSLVLKTSRSPIEIQLKENR